MTTLTKDLIWNALQEVKDPEIPAVSLVEMGIVQDVSLENDEVRVKMTPTFAGCPAQVEMKRQVENKLLAIGAESVEVDIVFNPAWTSDRITDEGRRKLKDFGLQPPHRHGGNIINTFFDTVACPRCDSSDTTLKNSFGSTLCRAIWYCHQCREPFEQFKPL